MNTQLLQELDLKIAEINALKEQILNTSEEQGVEPLYSLINRVESKKVASRIQTGIQAIDFHLGGFTEGTMINLAGQSFTGKSTLVIDAIKHIALEEKVLFFSFEMYENLLVKNKLSDVNDIQAENILIEQKRNDLNSIEAIIKKYSKDVRLFVIDSRMKIKVDSNLQEYQKNSLISSTLAKLTQELGCIILCIQQISIDDLKNGRLGFKGSGDTVYDSDIALFIVKDEKSETRTLICTKDRTNERSWKEDITDTKYQQNKAISETKFEQQEIEMVFPF